MIYRPRKGDVIRIEDERYPDYRIEGEVTQVVGNDVFLEGIGWLVFDPPRYERTVTLLRPAVRPIYENVDRDPAKGDVYFDERSANSSYPSVAQVILPDADAQYMRSSLGRRVLIFDGLKNETVPGARW